jgi:hypothetical protein
MTTAEGFFMRDLTDGFCKVITPSRMTLIRPSGGENIPAALPRPGKGIMTPGTGFHESGADVR